MWLIHDIPTCAELLSRIEKEAGEVLLNLSRSIGKTPPQPPMSKLCLCQSCLLDRISDGGLPGITFNVDVLRPRRGGRGCNGTIQPPKSIRPLICPYQAI